jgi:hemerythrin
MGFCWEGTEVVWQQLRRLGIQESDENHQVFGNIKQAMETLAKQRYIQKDKVASNEGNSFVFELAERAEDEAFKKKLQDFIKKLVSGDVAGDDPISP